MSKIVKFSAFDFREAAEFILLSTKHNETYGMVGLNLQGHIRFFNRGAEIITGYTEEEMIDRQVCVLFTPEDIAAGIPSLELKRAVKDGKAEDQRWHLRKDGSRFWAVGAMTLICDDKNQILGLCKIFHDDSVRKRNEDEILRANTELSKVTQVAAHDLQQPLRMVRTFLQLFVEKTGDTIQGEPREYLERAITAAAHMQDVVTGTLTLSQLEANAEDFQEVDCTAVVEAAVARLMPDIESAKGVLVRGPLPVVIGNPVQLGQVFENLISNALKFRAKDVAPRIEIQCDFGERECTFSVSDNGIGIPPAQATKIFDAYTRLHSKDKYSGSGLGLAICKKIIERHSGRIWEESLPGKGATFFFTLIRSKAKNPADHGTAG